MTPQFSDLPAGATVEHVPTEAPTHQFSDLPAGAVVEHVPTGEPDSFHAGLGEFWDKVNPISGIKGMAQAVMHPIDTFKSDAEARTQIATDAKTEFGKGNYLTGARKALTANVPFVGAQLDKSADQYEHGEPWKAAGSGLGIAANMAAPQALGKAVGGIRRAVNAAGVPERIYQSALKPSSRLSPERIAAMVQTGLQQGIPVSGGGLEKLGGLIDDLNGKIDVVVQNAGPDRQISPARAIANVDATKAKFQNQVNPSADMAAIEAAKADFLDQVKAKGGSLTASEAQAMKTGTYKQLKGRAYGELKSATVEAQKALARGLKEALVDQFPELAELNAKDGALLQLEPAIEAAVLKAANKQPMGTGPAIMGGIVKGATGSTGAAAAAGAMKAILSNPAISSRVGILLSRAGRSTFPDAMARVAGYADALGQVVDADASLRSDHPAKQ